MKSIAIRVSSQSFLRFNRALLAVLFTSERKSRQDGPWERRRLAGILRCAASTVSERKSRQDGQRERPRLARIFSG